MKDKKEQNQKEKAKAPAVKTHLKAGLFDVFRRPPNPNHNLTLVRDAAKAGGMKVKTNLKAGRTAVGPQDDFPVRRY